MMQPLKGKSMCPRHGKPLLMHKGQIGCVQCFAHGDKKKYGHKARVYYSFLKKNILEKNGLVECKRHPGIINTSDIMCAECKKELDQLQNGGRPVSEAPEDSL